MILDPSKVTDSSNIKNIIFDWGGVISNIDYNKTVEEFKKIGLDNFDEIYTQLKQTDLFDRLEIGTIDPQDFRTQIRKMLNQNPTNEEIDAAWSAMLLELPQERLSLLEKVKESYRIFLLSNTNIIHVSRYSKYIDKVYGFEKFKGLFQKVYYSHEVGLRKPHVEIFDFVINENNLKKTETLFIDDTMQHIEGALKAGLHAFHLKKPLQIIEIFKNGTN